MITIREPSLERLGAYEIIAFVAGFVLMAYEMVASRILAPSIGGSIYVWTSVIGVMIAALAAGYTIGGWLADKRVASQDIAWLLITSAVAMAGTLIFYEPLLLIITGTIGDVRLQAVVAAVMLFMPASFLLGTISPYLARLRVTSVTTAGRSVASLSALNSIGGILGTFCVGFIFFSLIGSRETLALLVVLLMLVSWLIMPAHRTSLRIIIMTCLVITLGLQLASRAQALDHIASIDTPTAHYDIRLSEYNGREIRVLMTDPSSYQSGIYTDDSEELVFDYTKRFVGLVDAAPRKDTIAILGGGAFIIPEALGKKYPNSHIDVVEIDPQLRGVAQHYFDYQEPPNVRTIGKDARTFLRESPVNYYDIIIVDAYGNDTAIPFSLTTQQYAVAMKRALKDDGAVLVNINGGSTVACEPLMTSLMGAYKKYFAQSYVFPATPGGDSLVQQNMMAVVSNAPAPWVEPFGPSWVFDKTHTITLTDNYAPTELLAQTCRDNLAL